MGLAGIGTAQLLIIAVIVLMIFGSKRIAQLGGDLGGMIKGMRGGFKDAEPVIDELAETKQELDSFKDSLDRLDKL